MLCKRAPLGRSRGGVPRTSQHIGPAIARFAVARASRACDAPPWNDPRHHHTPKSVSVNRRQKCRRFGPDFSEMFGARAIATARSSTSKSSCSALHTSVPKPDGATIVCPLKRSSSFQSCGAAAAFRWRFKSLFAAAKVLPTSPLSASLASSQKNMPPVSASVRSTDKERRPPLWW